MQVKFSNIHHHILHLTLNKSILRVPVILHHNIRCQIVSISGTKSHELMQIGEGKAWGLLGWNEVKFNEKHQLISGLGNSEFFYFVNSYYVVPDNKEIVFGQTQYGVDFCSALIWKNIVSTQFHVEKSGPVGLRLLKNFAEMDQRELC